MPFGDAGHARHDLPGRAVAALEAFMLDEGLLQRMQFSPCARPSIVVMLAPSCMAASVRHDTIRRPSSSIVQAPQAPWLHPFLVPVSSSVSRSTSSSDCRGSTFSDLATPLTVSRIGIVSDRCAVTGASAAAMGHGAIVAAAAVVVDHQELATRVVLGIVLRCDVLRLAGRAYGWRAHGLASCVVREHGRNCAGQLQNLDVENLYRVFFVRMLRSTPHFGQLFRK